MAGWYEALEVIDLRPQNRRTALVHGKYERTLCEKCHVESTSLSQEQGWQAACQRPASRVGIVAFRSKLCDVPAAFLASSVSVITACSENLHYSKHKLKDQLMSMCRQRLRKLIRIIRWQNHHADIVED